MNTTNQTTIDRIRKSFFAKDSDPVGLAGALVIKSTEQVTDTERVVEVIATTNAVDLDDEVVDPAGADWSYFNAAGQKKVFIDHLHDSEHNVGIARSISPYLENGKQVGWKMRVHVYTGLKCPHADDLWEKIKQGGMGLSVGFIAKEVSGLTPAEKSMHPNADTIVRKWKCVELSFTPSPCNVKCQTMKTGSKSVELPTLIIEC